MNSIKFLDIVSSIEKSLLNVKEKENIILELKNKLENENNILKLLTHEYENSLSNLKNDCNFSEEKITSIVKNIEDRIALLFNSEFNNIVENSSELKEIVNKVEKEHVDNFEENLSENGEHVRKVADHIVNDIVESQLKKARKPRSKNIKPEDIQVENETKEISVEVNIVENKEDNSLEEFMKDNEAMLAVSENDFSIEEIDSEHITLEDEIEDQLVDNTDFDNAPFDEEIEKNIEDEIEDQYIDNVDSDGVIIDEEIEKVIEDEIEDILENENQEDNLVLGEEVNEIEIVDSKDIDLFDNKVEKEETIAPVTRFKTPSFMKK